MTPVTLPLGPRLIRIHYVIPYFFVLSENCNISQRLRANFTSPQLKKFNVTPYQ